MNTEPHTMADTWLNAGDYGPKAGRLGKVVENESGAATQGWHSLRTPFAPRNDSDEVAGVPPRGAGNRVGVLRWASRISQLWAIKECGMTYTLAATARCGLSGGR